MDLLSNELNKPACNLYKHNLSNIMKKAISGSNA